MWCIGFLFFVYVFALSGMLFSLVNIKSKTTSSVQSKARFSIVVAFRNEVEYLPHLINSFASLDYPIENYEIIFVNDHSTDASVQCIQEFKSKQNNVILLQLGVHQRAKKAALQLGIETAQFEYIVTTDADCVVPENWLSTYAFSLAETNFQVLIGSVGIAYQPGFLAKFQYYDVLALQAVGFSLANLKHPILCNGANFCYQKEAFDQVNGFHGNLNQPSGDDVLLLQKFIKAKLLIGFVLHPENVVLTKAVTKLKVFVNQRKRWFYKTKQSDSLLQKGLGVVLLLVNFSILGLFFYAFFYPAYFVHFILLIIIKLSIDFLLTFEMAKKLKIPFCFTDFALANLFYPIGIAFFLGYLTNSKIQWKQRDYHS